MYCLCSLFQTDCETLPRDCFVSKYGLEMNQTVSPVTFSTGITWFYWDAYKEKIPNIPFAMMNPNDYGGYSAEELFVTKKYANYKEEILQHIPMNEYQTLIEFKVQQYMQSDEVKKLEVHHQGPAFYCYGLEGGAAIQQQHVCSLVLYCDFTEYCSRFSSTFRKLDRWETIESVKSRNQEYYWQSKHFRETVELFGLFPAEESGPFFCGVDCIMVIPSFCIRLRGPTSTSKQIEVAMNFAKDDGMILQLNNNGHLMADGLNFFDCTWLSNFAHEDERVFCGGWMTIRLEGIRIIATEQNYRTTIHSLFVLDCWLSGVMTDDGADLKLMKLSKKEVEILGTLLNGSPKSKNLDPFIIDTFSSYIKQKQQIKVFWDAFAEHKYPSYITGLISQAEITMIPFSDVAADDVNLLKPDILKTFKFTESFIINTTGNDFSDKPESYKFDLMDFAEIICHGNWKRITIESWKDSWISDFWSSDAKQAICDVYAEKGFKIALEYGIVGMAGGDEDQPLESLIVTRK